MGDEAREESLKISRPLVLTGGFQVFADQLYNRFIQLLAIAVGATVDQLGILNAVKSVASNILQVFFGRMADRFGMRARDAINSGLLISALLRLVLGFAYVATFESKPRK